jgi:hypothetical protein
LSRYARKGKPLVAQGKGKRQIDAPAKLDQFGCGRGDGSARLRHSR